MAKAKLVAAAERKALAGKRKPLGKTLVAIFTEKEKQIKKPKKEKKAMMTTKNIVKEPEKEEPKKEDAKPKSLFQEEGVERATHKPEPEHPNPAAPIYLSPAAAAEKEARETVRAQGSTGAPVVGASTQEARSKEDQSEKILRVLKTARVRLQGRGMPELDIEVDQLIGELEKKK